jgi:hypothetical protein
MNLLFEQVRKASRSIPLLKVEIINQVLLDVADAAEITIERLLRRMKRIWSLWIGKILSMTACN